MVRPDVKQRFDAAQPADQNQSEFLDSILTENVTVLTSAEFADRVADQTATRVIKEFKELSH